MSFRLGRDLGVGSRNFERSIGGVAHERPHLLSDGCADSTFPNRALMVRNRMTLGATGAGFGEEASLEGICTGSPEWLSTLLSSASSRRPAPRWHHTNRPLM